MDTFQLRAEKMLISSNRNEIINLICSSKNESEKIIKKCKQLLKAFLNNYTINIYCLDCEYKGCERFCMIAKVDKQYVFMDSKTNEFSLMKNDDSFFCKKHNVCYSENESSENESSENERSENESSDNDVDTYSESDIENNSECE